MTIVELHHVNVGSASGIQRLNVSANHFVVIKVKRRISNVTSQCNIYCAPRGSGGKCVGICPVIIDACGCIPLNKIGGLILGCLRNPEKRTETESNESRKYTTHFLILRLELNTCVTMKLSMARDQTNRNGQDVNGQIIPKQKKNRQLE